MFNSYSYNFPLSLTASDYMPLPNAHACRGMYITIVSAEEIQYNSPIIKWDFNNEIKTEEFYERLLDATNNVIFIQHVLHIYATARPPKSAKCNAK